tara:strand:- start:400 stop:549 length:150 start_codon:yes stop_codon:yes gene_type:complete
MKPYHNEGFLKAALLVIFLYDFFKNNFQNSLLNKIRQLEKQLKVFGDLS